MAVIDPKAVGSIPWIAPEVFLQKPHSGKSDIFSYAVVCWEIFAEKHPYADEIEKGEFDSNTLIRSIVNNSYRPRITKNFQKTGIPVPEVMTELIRKMWHRNPLARPEWSHVLETIEFARQKAKVLSRWMKANETAPKTCTPLTENEEVDYFTVRGSATLNFPNGKPNACYARRRSSVDSPTSLVIPQNMLGEPRTGAHLVPVVPAVSYGSMMTPEEPVPPTPADGSRPPRSISIHRIGDISLVTTPDDIPENPANPATAHMVITTQGQVKPFNLSRVPEPRRSAELNTRLHRLDSAPTDSSSIRGIIPEESIKSIETASIQRSEVGPVTPSVTTPSGLTPVMRRANTSDTTARTLPQDASDSSKRLRRDLSMRSDSTTTQPIDKQDAGATL